MDTHCGWLVGLQRGALFCGLVLLGLPGCGGGGGSDSPPTTQVATQVFDATYVGYAAGDRRLYRLADGVSFDAESVQRALTVRGVPAVEMLGLSGTATYLAVNERGVSVLPEETDLGVRSLFGEVPLLRFGPATAFQEVLYDVSKEITFSGPGGNSRETRSIHVSGWVKGFEDVTTPLGTFRLAARVRTEITSTARADEASLVAKVVTEEWYAKGIGVVKREVQSTSTGTPPVTQTYELLAYRVGGRRSDESAPALVSAVIAPAVRQSLPPPAIGVTYMQTTTFTFDDWLMPSPSLNGTATVQDAETGLTYRGSLTVGGDLRSLRFTIEHGLPVDRPLALVLPEAITDWAGNSMATRAIAFTRDTRGPQVVSMSPTALSGDIGAPAVFRVIFNEPVVATDTTSIVIRASDGAMVARLPVRAVGAALEATLTTALPGVGFAYDWTIEGNVLDAMGNAAAPGWPTAQFVTSIGRFSSAGLVVDWARLSASSLVDLDGDGRPDFVYWTSLEGTPTRGRLGARLGRTDGTFGPDTLLIETLGESFGNTYSDLRVGDFDGDGRRDIAIAGSGRLRVYLQRSSMSFDALAPQLFLGNIAGVIQGVAGPDTLLVIRWQEPSATRTFERLRLNVSSGVLLGFASIARDDAFRGRWSIGDIDSDGSLKLAWLLHTDDGRTELATAPITAEGFGATVRRQLQGPVVDLPVTNGSGRMAFGDVNGDTIADLVQLQPGRFGEPPSVVVWFGTGGDQFGSARTLLVRRVGGDQVNDGYQDAAAAKERGVYLGDLNGDGLDDMLFEVEWSASEVAIVRQLVDGSFVSISTAPQTADHPLRDFDGNGFVDVVGRNRIYFQSRGN